MRAGFLVTVLLVPLAATGTAAERPLTAADATAGKPLYLQECSACHGERGDGAGPAADFIAPRPRDFTKRVFKLRTTASGQAPATADVLRTIERGIPGTAMPSFAFLTEDERRKIAAFVLRVADVLDEPEPAPVADPGPVPAATPETIAHGKQMYVDAGCATCHGDTGRGDGGAAKDLKDTDGRPIAARDFTRDAYRGGGAPLDLYYRIATGLDGTPMPSYGDVLERPDLWAVVLYVQSLQTPVPAQPLPADPLEAGRVVVARHACPGCHVLENGKGGDVGPDLRLSGRKLRPEWVRAFLAAPREHGKIYPWRVYRMPRLPLADEEIDVLVRYLGAIGQRPATAGAAPDVAAFPADQVVEGKNLYMLRCTECHNLGTVIETPPIKRQGPDLIHAAGRLDYTWAREWILDPRKIDPKTKMVGPGLTPAQVDQVRMFVWKASADTAGSAHAAAH